MNNKLLGAKVSSIIEEINALKFQLVDSDKTKNLNFAGLKGLWRGKTHFSLEDIKKAEVKFKRSFQ